jgi:MFS family permease
MIRALPRPPIPRLARYTWGRHWPAVLIAGLAMGVLQLATFAARRSLGASERDVALLVALWQVSWILSPAVGPLLARVDPQRAWRWIGFFQTAPLMLIALVSVRPVGAQGEGVGNLALFIVAMFLYYLAGTAMVPHRGALLRANYAPAVRGRLYGLLQALSASGVMAAAWAAGALLDRDPRWLRLLFPVAAVLGFASYLLLSRIRWRGQRRAFAVGASASPWQAFRDSFAVLLRDRSFRTYEVGFMLYGFGFLMSMPLLVLFAEGELGVSYVQWTRAQMLAFPIAQICGLAVWGRLADRLGVVRTTAVAFLVLAAFFGLMPAVTSAAGLIVAFALFGLAMAGVDVGWSLGPLHFAPDGRAHLYAALHFSLVGVRSIFAPFLGFEVSELFGFRIAFLISAGLLILALATLLLLARRNAAERVS